MRSLAIRISLLFGLGVAFAMLALLGACSAGYSTGFPEDRVVRQARDVPDHFLVGRPDSSDMAEPVAGAFCRTPMVDPRDGMRLELVRSASGLGDYEVPAGRYGVSEGELLRLDCGTGRVIGIVEQ